MTIKYVKHSREVTAHDKAKYGKLADHDIIVTNLLMYELGKIKDGNGTPVDVNEQFLDSLLEKTNAFIKKRASNPYAKYIPNQFGEDGKAPLDKVQVIPVTKDHEPDQVDKQIGYSYGLVRKEKLEGKSAILMDFLITDPKAKKKIESGLLRSTSLGTREDGSIKEISFVSNEAGALCGLLFSENEPFMHVKKASMVKKLVGGKDTMVMRCPKSGLVLPEESAEETKQFSEQEKKELQFKEQLAELKFQEKNLTENVIPKHMIVSKLIKNYQLFPFQREEAMEQSIGLLQFIEKSVPAQDITQMFSINRPLQKINTSNINLQSDIDKLKHKFNELDQKKSGKSKKQTEPEKTEPAHNPVTIDPALQFEEARKQELKHILQLSEPNSLTSKYIKHELGEVVEDPRYKDKLIEQYLKDLANVRERKNQLILQFQEE